MSSREVGEDGLRVNLHDPAPKPCKDCPWLTINHGRRHADGWFTRANRARLWAKIRRGETMSCHRTDPLNPVPEGAPKPAADSTVRECTGSVILQQRELTIANERHLDVYVKERPKGLTRDGVASLVGMMMDSLFAPPFGSGRKIPQPNLNEPVSQDGLPWEPRK